ncbi:MAG: LITAF-like zinc ribbon domain-containing protein [Desulfobacterales bacterium]|nr:LITAF-like zinc ribbon domain-containing protein [Desulfobacterales bacterium]
MDLKSVNCKECQQEMDIVNVKKYDGKTPIVLLIGGIFCLLFLGGPFLGVPMILGGVYMLTSKITISYCPNCGNYFKVLMINKKSS